jgi:tRNA modification GTPase
MQMTAHLEAGLDFVEEDIEFITAAELFSGIEKIRLQLQRIGRQFALRGSGSRNLEVLLVGPPNAGKSSLFNALIGEQRAIVSPIAGTTRDVITGMVEREGLQFQLVDTAGLEEVAGDTPRGLAQQQLAERLHAADLLLICIDCSADAAEQVQEHLDRFQSLATPCLRVGTKQDLLPARLGSSGCEPFDVLVSVHDAHSLEQLQTAVANVVGTLSKTSMAEALQHTAIRCLAAVDQANQSLERAQQLIRNSEGEELVATELRCVLDQLAAMIGEVHSDTILGEIFSRFCIGK